ncbi:MAG: hypothetical protein P1P59_10590, partial [Treponemataceae bacterium]
MKKLIYVLALVGMLFSCSKNTDTSIGVATEPTTDAQNEASAVVQSSTSVENTIETVAENKTEEPWIALIEKEIVEVSFKSGAYKIIPTTEGKFFTINLDLGNGLHFYIMIKSKNDTDLDPMDMGTPENFQKKAKSVLSASNLPQNLRTAKGAVEVNGYKFKRDIRLTKFDPSIVLFDLSYYTTTPMYTLECTFYKNPCDEFKQEVPQYFEKGGWKMEMPSGKTG